MEPGDNMAVASSVAGKAGLFFHVLALNINDNSLLFLCAVLAWLWLRRRYKALSYLYLLTFSLLAWSIFVKPDYFKYYCFVLAAFVPFVVLPLAEVDVWRGGGSRSKLWGWGLATVAVVLELAGSDNVWKMRLKKDDYIQFRFARTIMKEENPTLLNYYCQDQGVFAVTGIVPVNRYYCDYNNELPDVHVEHDSIIACRGVQFVITMMRFDFEGYRIVDQAECPVKGVVFYLYKRE